ncbi:low temperature requirement protein A [Micromonospora antibiotica]|uniref:low temperature requirement protein A n=1 Tax=Micromonospora antibiotica TaxID=2807623 RepID=UPI001FCA39CE|nr:low temperature requirement protein A [Micromonospora antibiotica]
MTGGEQAAPLRRTGSAQGATFLELFFDLVYVFALTRISFRAFEDLALEPGGTTGWSPVTGASRPCCCSRSGRSGRASPGRPAGTTRTTAGSSSW